jgi:hypothetical protein
MTHDVHDLLDEAAPVPTRTVDLDGVLGTARRRKRRARTAGALAGAVVIAAAVAGTVAVASGSGSTSLAVRAGSPATSIPDGWTRVTVDGVSLAIPPGWSRQAPGAVQNEVWVVGSAQRPGPGAVSACLASSPSATVPGTWVSLYEYPPGSTTLVDPEGAPIVMNPVPARPNDFHNGPNVGQGTCSGSTDQSPAAAAGNPADTFDLFAFTDAGRLFLARVVTLGSADPSAARLLGRDVLNTLHVDPVAADATTTTSAPDTSTTVPDGTDTGPVSTTLPPNAVGESADQLAVRTAFLGWLNGKTLDEAAPYVDDLASIRDAVRQGMAQHTAQDLAGFSGRVESVVIADPTHADVVYTVLHDDAPLYANRAGKAVKVDGTWKVTRDTECALLAVGGVTCPPPGN